MDLGPDEPRLKVRKGVFMFSLLKRTIAKKVAFAGLVLLLLAVALGSCSTESTPTLLDKLQGQWVGAYDKYGINGNVLTNYDSEGNTNFIGKIIRVIELPLNGTATENDASGVIIYQFISPPTEYAVNYNNGYTALYYKGDANGNTLMLASAYDVEYSGYPPPPVDTQYLNDINGTPGAITKFTASDYFDKYIGAWGGFLEYTR